MGLKIEAKLTFSSNASFPFQAAFETSKKRPKTDSTAGYKDPEFYMSHYQSGAEHDTKG